MPTPGHDARGGTGKNRDDSFVLEGGAPQHRKTEVKKRDKLSSEDPSEKRREEGRRSKGGITKVKTATDRG